MSGENIIKCLKTLSERNSIYKKVYKKVTSNTKEGRLYLKNLVDAEFEDISDLIVYFES